MDNPFYTTKMQEDYRTHVKHIDECLKMQLLEYAEPKLKEPITKSKLKWRGITMCNQPSTGMIWIEQRGKVLGEKINITVNVKYDGRLGSE